jgi:hypothetical protein
MARGACAACSACCSAGGITMATGASGAIGKHVCGAEHGRHGTGFTRSARTKRRDPASGESLCPMTVQGSRLRQGRAPAPSSEGSRPAGRTTRGVCRTVRRCDETCRQARRGTSHRRCDRSAGDSGPVATESEGAVRSRGRRAPTAPERPPGARLRRTTPGPFLAERDNHPPRPSRHPRTPGRGNRLCRSASNCLRGPVLIPHDAGEGVDHWQSRTVRTPFRKRRSGVGTGVRFHHVE